MDTKKLRDAYRTLLHAAAEVSNADKADPAPGEWNADQILAHVSILTAATISAASAVTSGVHTTYDNRIAHDVWTLGRTIERAGGTAGLRDRLRYQSESLCTLVEYALSDADLDTPIPTLFVSHDQLMLDQTLPLRDIVAGLADAEVPGHTKQIEELLPR